MVQVVNIQYWVAINYFKSISYNDEMCVLGEFITWLDHVHLN